MTQPQQPAPPSASALLPGDGGVPGENDKSRVIQLGRNRVVTIAIPVSVAFLLQVIVAGRGKWSDGEMNDRRSWRGGRLWCVRGELEL